MGRPPKPTKLLELTGAFRKNPSRLRSRADELVSEGDVGGPPQQWMIFHPSLGYQRAEKLRSLWDECKKLWPWLTPADRHELEMYVRLKQRFDEAGSLRGTEMAAMRSARTNLGGTAAGRQRGGAFVAPAPKQGARAQQADPRAQFLGRKTG